MNFHSSKLIFASAGAFLLVPAGTHAQDDSASPRITTTLDESVSGRGYMKSPASAETMAQAKAFGVRTDGFYKANQGRYDESKAETYTVYIRFCDNGMVLFASTSGTTQQVAKWLVCEPLDRRRMNGSLVLDGRSMSVIANFGRNEYDFWGEIPETGTNRVDQLTLRERIRPKGGRSFRGAKEVTYTFAPI